MTDRPGDEAEPIEVEAVADDRPAEEAAGTPEEKAAARRRRRGRLFLLLWLLPVVLIAALGYLVAAQPERLAAFLAGPPPDMATAADIERLTERLLKAEVESALDRAQAVTAHSAAITDSREETVAKVAAEAAASARGARERSNGGWARGWRRWRRASLRSNGVEPAIRSGSRCGDCPSRGRRLPPWRRGLRARTRRQRLQTRGWQPLKAAVAALQSRVDGLEAGEPDGSPGNPRRRDRSRRGGGQGALGAGRAARRGREARPLGGSRRRGKAGRRAPQVRRGIRRAVQGGAGRGHRRPAAPVSAPGRRTPNRACRRRTRWRGVSRRWPAPAPSGRKR